MRAIVWKMTRSNGLSGPAAISIRPFAQRWGWLSGALAALLALVTVIGTFALFGLAFFLKVDGANEFMVLGALSSSATTVIGFNFGSSEGSRR